MDTTLHAKPSNSKPLNLKSNNTNKRTKRKDSMPQRSHRAVSGHELPLRSHKSDNRLQIGHDNKCQDEYDINNNVNDKTEMDLTSNNSLKSDEPERTTEEDTDDLSNEMIPDEVDTGTDDEDYSIPEYSDSESILSDEDRARQGQGKDPTLVYEVERKVSPVFNPNNNLSPHDLVILRDNRDSCSSVTDSNIEIIQRDSSQLDQESSGDDQHVRVKIDKLSRKEDARIEKLSRKEAAKVEKLSIIDAAKIEKLSRKEESKLEKLSRRDAAKKSNDSSEVNFQVSEKRDGGNFYSHSETSVTPSDDNQDDDCYCDSRDQFKSEERPYHLACPFLPPLPWISRFRQNSRPGWDSSPYNPNCNKPAWDSHLYVEARERFKRHEAVKSRSNGFEFQLYPVAIANQRPTSYGQPLYDVNRFATPSKNTTLQTPVKPSTDLVQASHSNESNPLKPEKEQMSLAPLESSNINSRNISKENKQHTVAIPKTVVVDDYKSVTSSNTGDNNIVKSTQPAGDGSSITTSIKKLSSNIPRIVPFPRRDYSPSWRKIAQDERRKALAAAKEKPQEPEKPKTLNPLPRVALICKPNHRKSTSGSGGYYSPSASMRPGVQVFDDRGRIKPTWDPSPFVPIGKKNAWDDSIPKTDYYRSKFIGWM